MLIGAQDHSVEELRAPTFWPRHCRRTVKLDGSLIGTRWTLYDLLLLMLADIWIEGSTLVRAVEYPPLKWQAFSEPRAIGRYQITFSSQVLRDELNISMIALTNREIILITLQRATPTVSRFQRTASVSRAGTCRIGACSLQAYSGMQMRTWHQ